MGSHSRSDRHRDRHRPPSAELVAETLAAAAQQSAFAPADAVQPGPLIRLLFDLDAAHPERVDLEGVALLDRLLASAWTAGWQPADLAELVQRRLPAVR